MAKKMAFNLDLSSGVPYYKQIMLQVEMAVASGRFATGDQLPTVRSLAVDLQVNPNTVARAYNELELRGIVTSQQGTGTFLSDIKIKLSDIKKEKLLAELVQNLVNHTLAFGITLKEVIRYLEELEGSEKEKPHGSGDP